MSGFGLPRQYGGLNMPVTVFSAVCEMISRADASFQNVWGLQSCADTINEFGAWEQSGRTASVKPMNIDPLSPRKTDAGL